MLKTISENTNYLCKIVLLPELREHPNADRLSLVTIDNQVIITSRDAVVGSLYVYFPLECQINQDFISYINGFSDAERNRDKTKKGFFNPKRRVRGVKLREIVSEGYLHPASEVNSWLKSQKIKFNITESNVGEQFDSFGETLFVQKYTVPVKHIQDGTKKSKKARESRIVEGQFYFHPDTAHLKRELDKISPNDEIEILSKWHGACCVCANLLTKRPLSLVEKIARFFGAQINDEKYSVIASSRRVIKTKDLRDNPAQSFYDSDVWTSVANKYQESILPGISLFGELVGHTPTGAGIQSFKGKVYDYGCEFGKCDFFVFRITYTSPKGHVFEFSVPQIIEYCNKYALKHVPVYFVGKAKDKYPDLDIGNHWHENFLDRLIAEYLEKDDVYCNSKGLADEGIVLSKRIGAFQGFKLKSSRFVLAESVELDSEKENIEDS